MVLLDSSGADTFTAYAYDSYINETTKFIDRADSAGKDTIIVKNGASVYVVGADDNAPTSDIDIVLNDNTNIRYVAVGWDDLAIFANGKQVAYIEDGRALGAGVEIALKYDNGSSVTTLKSDLSALASSDYSKIAIVEMDAFFSNSITAEGVFRPDFISVINVGFWDPLVVDLDHDGFAPDLLGMQQYFDLGGDGYAELTAWSGGGDGFLVRDLNSNGRIDNGTEMFGTASVDGFTMLGTFDLNADHVINSSDAVWSTLKIWNDANGDAQTQSDEVHSLASLGITSINLNSVTSVLAGQQQISGVGFLTHTGTVQTTTGTMDIGNFIFQRSEQNSRYAGDYTLDLRTLGLPDLIGHSKYADLHIAMSLDNDTGNPGSLLSIMQDIAGYSFVDAMAHYDEVKGKVGDLLFRWLGVDDVSPTARGPFLEDGRVVDFILAMVNGQFVDPTTGASTVGSVQARGVEDLWDTLLREFTATILFQTVGHQMYGTSVHYDLPTGALTGTFALSQDALDALQAHAAGLANTAAREAFWVNAVDFIYDMQTARYENKSGAFSDLSSSQEAMLNAAIEGSDANLTWYKEDHSLTGYPVSIEHREFNPVGSTIEGDNNANDYTITPAIDGTSADDTIHGYGGGDVLNGHAGNDVIYGDDGNDTLYGEGGTDILYGGAGNDILNPGIGVSGSADMVFGEDGNDTLYVGGGGQVLGSGGAGDDLYLAQTQAWITDSSGYDTIKFITQSGASNIIWKRAPDDTLEMNLNGVSIHVQNFFNHGTVPIELLTFATGSETVDLTNLTQQITTYGTAAGETIYGIEVGASSIDTIYSGDGNDSIYGGTGNDTIYGENGNDTLDGGAGNDQLYGGNGHNTFIASAGTDTINGGYSVDVYNVLRLNNGTQFADLEFVRHTTALYDLSLDHATGSVLVSGHFLGGRVDEIQVGDTFSTLMTNVSITTLGTGGNDTIGGVTVGGSPDDIIYGYGGNDTISSSAGNDTIYAGDGDDTINGGSGSDLIEGGNGNDNIKGTSGADTIYGGNGDDTLYGYDSGGSTETSADTLYGGDGNDTVWGWDGNDVLDGGAGNDTLQGRAGNDTYHYDSGLDTITEISGTDTLVFDGSIKVDALSFQRVGFNAVIILNSGTDQITMDARFSSTYSDNTYRVDTLQFDDGFTLNWINYWSYNTSSWSDGTFIADQYENTILGVSSNDTISALAGDDTVHGRAGNDTIDGGAGNDRLHGGDGNDTVLGGTGNDTIWGGAGNDTVSFSGATASVTASLLTGTATGEGSDTFTGIENISGSAYADTLTGDANANILGGSAGNDALSGNDGNDTLIGGTGNDTLDGGAGVDTADYSAASSAVTVSLTAGTATGGDGSDTLTGIENVIGSLYADTIYGDNNTNRIDALAGNDTIYSYAANDLIYAGDGDDYVSSAKGSDTIYGGAGNDRLFGDVSGESDSGNDALFGEDGDDELYGSDGADALDGGAGVDILEGGNGNDTLRGGDGIDTLKGQDGADLIYGDAGNDTIYGDDGYTVGGADTIYGGSGVDTIDGRIGDDLIYGGDDGDTIKGSLGNDTLYGDAGNDNLYGDDDLTTVGHDTLYGGAGVDLLEGRAGNDTLNGGDDGDTLKGGLGNDTLYGDAGNDNLYGDDDLTTVGHDTLYGGAGVDLLEGRAGDDVLNGNAGVDTLKGQDGNDTLWAGDGADNLYGGAGTNIFALENKAGNDNDMAIVQDWNTGSGNKIDISDLLTGYNSGTDSISDFVNVTVGTHTTISVDRDGTGTTYGWDDVLRLQGITSFETNENTLVSNGTLLVA